MTLFSGFQRLLLLAPLALCLSGCFQMSGAPEDEEKDPHFLAGKNCVSAMDYDGAIAAFEQALEANPKSAAAHLQLAWLYEDKKQKYADAIYHFEKCSELKPDPTMEDNIKQRIFSCKLELARTVPFALVSAQVQDEMRKLHSTNSALQQSIEQLRTELSQQAMTCSNRLAALMQAQAQAQAAALAQVQPQIDPTPEPEARPLFLEKRPSSPLSPVSTRLTTTTTPRTHTVRQHETLATIARKYNLKLSSLEAANPTVDARRLRAGQVLNLPGKAGN